MAISTRIIPYLMSTFVAAQKCIFTSNYYFYVSQVIYLQIHKRDYERQKMLIHLSDVPMPYVRMYVNNIVAMVWGYWVSLTLVTVI